MEIKQTKTNKLIPYVNNAKTHSSDQIIKIASSIKEFGFNNPILIDGENGVIAGHGRLQAALKLGLETVPTIELSHMSEPQKKAYILADNKLSEVGTDWDMELVKIELDDFNVELTGFDVEDFEIPNFQPGSEEDQGKLDQLAPKWITCPHCGGKFDERKN